MGSGADNRDITLDPPGGAENLPDIPEEISETPATGEFSNFLEVGDNFKDFTILQFCGRGAYGEVYLAEDVTRKVVALKIIPISAGSEVWRAELVGLRHYRQSIDDYSALIQIYHVGESENYFYYTMEAADNMVAESSGEYVADSLAHRLARGGRMEPEKVLELAFTLLDALANLAKHDLAHRDLKPANIVFINGKAKLGDVGLICNTGVRSQVVGTAEFFPPELENDDPVNNSNDLYALGKVLYCALTGFLPDRYPEIPPTLALPIWRQFRPVILRACAEDPRQRFYTSAEFRRALPKAIHKPSRLEEAAEEVRNRYLEHPMRWRMYLTTLVLVILGAVLNAYLNWSQMREKEREQQERIEFIFRTIDDLRTQFTHLERLSESSGKQATCRQLEIMAELAVSERAAGHWAATERYCLFADNALRRWAEESGQAILDSCPDNLEELSPMRQEELLKICYDFTETPLFQYLNAASTRRLLRVMADLKKLWNAEGKLPTPGETWRWFDDENLEFVYVPQGRLADEPQQSYWIGANEVTAGSMKRLAKENYGRSEIRMPAVNLSWNERLVFCERMNEYAQKQGALPEGYIYRLPTLNEWKFAFRGGWRSRGVSDYEQRALGDMAWFSGNSDYNLHNVRTRQPGLLGLYDMAGNAAETVLDDGKIVLAGASYRDRRIVSNLYRDCQAEDVEQNQIGFRLVLGCGKREDLVKAWYYGDVFRYQNSHFDYELLGGKSTRWQGEIAAEWARLLGGAGAILKNDEESRNILQAIRLRSSAVLLGATLQDTEWRWCDGTPLADGVWVNNPGNMGGEGEYLVSDHGYWRGIPATETVAWMLVQWPHGAFEARQTALQNGKSAIPESKLIQKRFTLDDKEYLLITAPVDWYTGKRLAELLGARLAMPKTSETVAAIGKELAEFANQRIALGGYRFFERWQWLDKTPAPEAVPRSPTHYSGSLVNSFLSLNSGKLCCDGTFDAILCELPAKK